ncbi:MAG: hypothetical protein OEZ06_20175, partial [Myxococcales bacterium]|nr:hypothetical protein [Myxococcales bacterium]
RKQARAGDGALRQRPGDYVPVLVPKYDSSAGEYNWVYRPEMQFSMFDLDPKTLTLTHTDGTTSEHDANAEDKAVYSEDIDTIDLAYTLLTDPNTLQLETFDGTRELVFTFGDQNPTATIGTDAESGTATATFTNAATLGNASADEFATIRLVQNGDEPNVLWKYEFKDVKIVLEDYEGSIKPGQTVVARAVLRGFDGKTSVIWNIDEVRPGEQRRWFTRSEADNKRARISAHEDGSDANANAVLRATVVLEGVLQENAYDAP